MTNLIPATERRCPKCDPGMNWTNEVSFCPLHGESVRPMLKRVCLCGFDGNANFYSYCIKCGKVLEETK